MDLELDVAGHGESATDAGFKDGDLHWQSDDWVPASASIQEHRDDQPGDELNRGPGGRFEVGGVRDRQQEGHQQTIRSKSQNERQKES